MREKIKPEMSFSSIAAEMLSGDGYGYVVVSFANCMQFPSGYFNLKRVIKSGSCKRIPSN